MPCRSVDSERFPRVAVVAVKLPRMLEQSTSRNSLTLSNRRGGGIHEPYPIWMGSKVHFTACSVTVFVYTADAWANLLASMVRATMLVLFVAETEPFEPVVTLVILLAGSASKSWLRPL